MSKSQEHIGEICILLTATVSGLFPVLIHYASNKIPALFYASISLLLAGALLFIIMWRSGKLHELLIRKFWPKLAIITLCITAIPSILIYKGTTYTSGINTGILLEAEMLFAFLLTWFVGERMTLAKALGGLGVFLGTSLVLYNGAFHLNIGDVMIVAGTFFYPIGNIYAKKVLQTLSPVTIIFVRSFFGGLFLLLAYCFELTLQSQGVFENLRASFFDATHYWQIVLLNGLLVWGISKIFWYEGLKRLDVSKATVLGMAYPALSIVLSIVFFKEAPTFYQLGGFVLILAGVYAIMQHKSVPITPF